MDNLDATPMDASESLSAEDRIESIISGESSSPESESVPTDVTETESPSEEVEVEATSETPDQDTDDIVEFAAADIASLFGVEEDALQVDEEGNVQFKTKVNGEEGAATLRDLIKGHQLEQNVNRKSMELSEMQKAFDAERAQQFQALNAQLEQASQLSDFAEQQLMQEYHSIDWNALRERDSGEFAAMQQDYTLKSQQIQQMKANIEQHKAQTNQQLHQQQQQWRAGEVQRQQEMLLNQLPEWKDQATAKKEAQEIEKYLLSVGYSEQETAGMIYARDLITARKAMLFDQMQGKTKPDQKKVNRKLRVQKPNSAQSKGLADKSSQNKRRAVLKKSGSLDAMASVLADMI